MENKSTKQKTPGCGHKISKNVAKINSSNAAANATAAKTKVISAAKPNQTRSRAYQLPLQAHEPIISHNIAPVHRNRQRNSLEKTNEKPREKLREKPREKLDEDRLETYREDPHEKIDWSTIQNADVDRVRHRLIKEVKDSLHVENLLYKMRNDITLTPKSTEIKNYEAIADLRQRIPEIEDIFDVHTRIGNGTFSTVLMGTLKKERFLPEQAQRKFAIKHHVPTSNPERVRRELQCMARMGGVSNVCGINCCIRSGESVAFIMPYLSCDRFHDYFTKMDLTELQNYLKNLLIALRHVHQFNVIHRDVKPGNFLYDRIKRKFLLIDFGLAQQVQVNGSQTNLEIGNSASVQQICFSNETTRRTGSKRMQREEFTSSIISASEKPTTYTSTTMSRLSKQTKTSTTTTTTVPANTRTSSYVASTRLPSGPNISNTASSLRMQQKLAELPKKSISVRASMISNPENNSTVNMAKVQPLQFRNINDITTAKNKNAGEEITIADAVADSGKFGTSNNVQCDCFSKEKMCSKCLSGKKKKHASRAGTPGYRPPEVLLRFIDQTTAVDMWSVGVILMTILSSVYPFFKAPNDNMALSEMITIFGDRAMRKTATTLGKVLMMSQQSKALDLRALCVRFRNRRRFAAASLLKKYQSADGSCDVCPNCDQYYFNCLCARSRFPVREPLDDYDTFPLSVYDLLSKLLELDPFKRITAAEALEHPFFQEVQESKLRTPRFRR